VRPALGALELHRPLVGHTLERSTRAAVRLRWQQMGDLEGVGQGIHHEQETGIAVEGGNDDISVNRLGGAVRVGDRAGKFFLDGGSIILRV